MKAFKVLTTNKKSYLVPETQGEDIKRLVLGDIDTKLELYDDLVRVKDIKSVEAVSIDRNDIAGSVKKQFEKVGATLEAPRLESGEEYRGLPHEKVFCLVGEDRHFQITKKAPRTMESLGETYWICDAHFKKTGEEKEYFLDFAKIKEAQQIVTERVGETVIKRRYSYGKEI